MYERCLHLRITQSFNHVLREQFLLQDTKDLENSMPSRNIIMQLFSPLVTSQHIMTSQFGNSYTSIKCQDGTNMVFNEFIGYTFMYIATDEVELMRRTLGIYISIVHYICGPDVTMSVYIK